MGYYLPIVAFKQKKPGLNYILYLSFHVTIQEELNPLGLHWRYKVDLFPKPRLSVNDSPSQKILQTS